MIKIDNSFFDEKKTDFILKILLVMSIGIAVYSILTIGQCCIHSDTATATLLAQAQLKYHSFIPKSWCYANGDVWVIGPNLFTMPFYLLMNDQSLARMMGSAILVLITVFAMYLHGKYFLKSRSWLLSIPVFLLFTFEQYDMTLYQAAYTSAMMWIVLSLWLVYGAVYGENRRRFIILYCLLTFILILGGIRYIGEVTVPLIGTVCIMIYSKIPQQNWQLDMIFRNLAGKLLIIIAPVIPSILAYKVICSSHTVINTVNNRVEYVSGIEKCLDNIWRGVKAIFSCFGLYTHTSLFSTWGIRNIVSIVVCALIMFIIPVLQFMKYKNETEELKFFLIFAVIHNLEMIVLYAVFNKTEPRYLLSSVFLTEIISCRYIYEYWLTKMNFNKVLIHAAYSVIALIYIISLTYPNRSWSKELMKQKEFCKVLVDHGLNKGYASYWNAYNNEIYSDMKLRFGAGLISREGMSSYYWLVDRNVFIPEDGIDTFLLLDEKENRIYGKKLAEQFGKTKDDFIVESDEKKFYVYIYDYDIAIKMKGDT